MAPYGTEVLPEGSFDHSTLRETVHLSCGGSRVRVVISNVFGAAPLTIGSVQVALPARAEPAGTIDPSTSRMLLFSGHSRVTVPMGSEYVSEPVDMPVPALADLVVTIAIEKAPPRPTLHAGARTTSLLMPGDHSADPTLANAQRFTRWYFLSGVQVSGASEPGAVVTLGDSITDGHGSTIDANDRWPDVLARRLAAGAHATRLGVVNEGIGGNRVLQDGIGTSALARLDRDVIAQEGVRYLIVLEGINDLGGLDRVQEHSQPVHDALVASLEGAFMQIILRAHAHGMRVFGGTLTPYLGSDYYHPSERSEADRQALNQWIRTSGAFDGVIDFDAALRDPAKPDHLLALYDSGDHLHPGPRGYQRMGEAISLKLFKK